jgi:hypothetical protein
MKLHAEESDCSVTFYGIYTNAQLAAYAYRVATERISQMAASYTPEKSNVPVIIIILVPRVPV